MDLPAFDAAGMTLLKRLTLILSAGRVEDAIDPVFPPDRGGRSDQGPPWHPLSRQRRSGSTNWVTARAEPTGGSEVRWKLHVMRGYLAA